MKAVYERPLVRVVMIGKTPTPGGRWRTRRRGSPTQAKNAERSQLDERGRSPYLEPRQTKPIRRSGDHRVSRGLGPKSPGTNEANSASADGAPRRDPWRWGTHAHPTWACRAKRSQFRVPPAVAQPRRRHLSLRTSRFAKKRLAASLRTRLWCAKRSQLPVD